MRDHDDRHVYWAQRSEVVDFVSRGLVDILWSGKQVRYLRFRDGRGLSDFETSGQRGELPYSHNHAVEEVYRDAKGKIHKRNAIDANARGCWTLRRIPKNQRELFTSVLEGVVTSKQG